jgi:hypothetical protein
MSDAIENARNWVADISAMIAALNAAEAADGERDAIDTARQAIDESILSVLVRDGWRHPGHASDYRGPAEYELLLSTGGPALRIRGEVENGEPTSARLQYQDWFTPWTDLELTAAEYADVTAFAQNFYYGD